MKRYLALILSVIMAISMSMTVCAAPSPTASSSSHHSSGSGSGSSSSSLGSSSGTATASTPAATGVTAITDGTPAASALKSIASTSAAEQAAVIKAVQPVQRVIVNGQEVAAKVNVAAINQAAAGYVNVVLGAIAPNWSLVQTFAYNVASSDASIAQVTTALSIPAVAGVDAANIRLVAFDPSTGAYAVITPIMAANGTIVVTVPTNAVLSVVYLNA